jgi:quercetin dioxygenase-like cupin family protein
MYVPDITRVFKGARNEFEVEIVFAEERGESPRESHPFDELLVLLEGDIELERSDEEATQTYSPTCLVEIPAGVEHVIKNHTPPTKLIMIHPRRVPED